MGQHIALLVLGVLILQWGIAFEVRIPRVAIIGGGIGGASASHFLTELFNGSVQIDLYEARAIGGRLPTLQIDEDEVEAGGWLIHPKNMYMQRFVKLLGLEKITFNNGNFGLWDRDNFVFDDDRFITLLRNISVLIHSYEPNCTIQSHVDNIMQDFLKIYDLQDAGQVFTSIDTLLFALNIEFQKRSDISTRKYFLNAGCTEKMINELVQAATMMNYGQEVDIHSVVGLLSLTTLNNELWSVKGGNKKVPQLLINKNKNVNVVRGRVTKIRFRNYQFNLGNIYDPSEYEVTHINRGSTDPMISNYDSLIIATPLTRDQEFPIEFVRFPHNMVSPGNYQITYATFFKADFKPENYTGQSWDFILSCNPNKTKNITFIGKANLVDGSIKENSTIWKIFSREHMYRSIINDLFSNVTGIVEFIWNAAYPRYSTNVNRQFKLHNAVYHVNAIECAASTMEMSVIGGRNAALLAHMDYLYKAYGFVSNKTAENLIKNIRTEL